MGVKDLLYFAALCAGVILSVIRYPSLRPTEKIIGFLLLTTLVQEIVSFSYFLQARSNIVFIRFFSLFEFLFITAYYLLLSSNRITRLLISLLTTGGLLWFFFRKPSMTGEPEELSFLLFESSSILFISLLSCLQLVLRESTNPFQSAGFWITLSFVIYWSMAYTRFGLLVFPNSVSAEVRMVLENAFFFTNIAFYSALATILAFYKKFSVSS